MRKNDSRYFFFLLPKSRMPKGFALRKKRGFTLIEMVVVIAMMSILAAAGVAGYQNLVTHFTKASCVASREDALQALVSEYLQGELPSTLSQSQIDQWLNGRYKPANHTSDSAHWTQLTLQEHGGMLTFRLGCTRHTHTEVERQVRKLP